MWENFIAQSRRASFVAAKIPMYPTLFQKCIVWRDPDGVFFGVLYYRKKGAIVQYVDENAPWQVVKDFIEHSSFCAPEYASIRDNFRKLFDKIEAPYE